MTAVATFGRLETELRAKRDAGRKLLVPYITGGYPGWQAAIRACAANGADAVEIGIPFSDPGDGRSGDPAGLAVRARAGSHPDVDPRRGTGPRRRHPARRDDLLQPRPSPRPHAVRRSAEACGISAAILPDLPLEESGPVVRGRRCRGHRNDHARRADRARRTAAPCGRSLPWLRVLGGSARCDGRARVARRDRDGARRPDSSASPTRRCSSASACRMPSRRTRRHVSPTG